MKLRALICELPKASAQSAALWMAGDALCQKLEAVREGGHGHGHGQPGRGHGHGGVDVRGYDFRRTGVNGIYGGVFLGPLGHFWYYALDTTVNRALPGGTAARKIGAKLAADLGLFGPFHLAAFLAWTAAASATHPRATISAGADGEEHGGGGGGGIWAAVKTSIGKDFTSALLVDTFYWLPVQAFNFAVMPVSKQLLFMNAACVVDAAFLSWLGSHSGALGSLWKELLGTTRKETGAGAQIEKEGIKRW